jgi:hypothetical protein
VKIGKNKKKVPMSKVSPLPFDAVAWWHRHRKACPHTYQMVRKLALLQPSSAMAERIFSMLQAFFPQMGRRGRCYQDFILLCMQLNAHYRSVHPGAL